MWGLPDSRRHRPCESGSELAHHLPSRQTARGRWLRSPLLAGARLRSGAVWLCPHPPLALGSSFRCGASAASSWRVVSGAAAPLRGAVWSTLRLLRGAARAACAQSQAHPLALSPGRTRPQGQGSAAVPAGRLLCSGTCRETLSLFLPETEVLLLVTDWAAPDERGGASLRAEARRGRSRLGPLCASLEFYF